MENIKMTKSESGKLGNLKRSINLRKKYKENPKLCIFCGIPLSFEERYSKKFCGHSCAAKYNNAILNIKKEGTILQSISIDDINTHRKIGFKRKFVNVCLNCGSKCRNKYCSVKCQKIFNRSLKLKLWKSGKLEKLEIINTNGQLKPLFRSYIMDKYNEKCIKCGWNEKNPTTKKCPLEVDHIDGNSNNNLEENLTLLCPNCHSLTPTYKSLNKGKGRNQRMKRYYDGKTF